MKALSYLSLFSGIGAFEKALDALGIPFKLVGYCEIDKYASKSYSAIHDVPETMNLGDITKIDEKALPKDIDLITYGFPCQDISLAGKQKGLFNEDGSQTRSGLFFEALRIIEETQPRVAIAENVKNLVGKKFNAQFQIVLASLEAAGYNNYWQVLNAKDYGIPQNRERVFIVSIRKDIDTGSFNFPEPFPLELRMKDMLEDEVDEKYYLSEKMVDFFIENTKKMQEKGNGFKFNPTNGDGVAKTITTRAGCRMDDNFINMVGMLDIKGNEQVRRIYGTDGISPTLNTMQGGNRQPKVLVREATNLQPLNASSDGTCRCIKSQYYKTGPANLLGSGFGATGVADGLRIRKLTPKECFRLMGFSDEDFAKAEAVNSNTQLYKQAGNSIVVDVIAHIFTQLKEM